MFFKQKNKGTEVILNVEFWILNVDQVPEYILRPGTSVHFFKQKNKGTKAILDFDQGTRELFINS